MLSFFRRLRRSLIEEGHLKTYAVYAVGEILLVMIGILLALQVNNWNSQKQERIELHGFLNNISKNVRSDLLEIRELKTYRDSTRIFSSRIMSMVGSERIEKEEFYAVWDWKYNPQKTLYFTPDLSGFDALKSSGYLGKLQGKTLEDVLYQYYDLAANLSVQQDNLNGFLENMSMKLAENNVWQELDALRYDSASYSKGFVDESRVVLELLQHPIMKSLHRRNRDNQGVANLYEELLIAGEELIRLVEAETG